VASPWSHDWWLGRRPRTGVPAAAPKLYHRRAAAAGTTNRAAGTVRLGQRMPESLPAGRLGASPASPPTVRGAAWSCRAASC